MAKKNSYRITKSSQNGNKIYLEGRCGQYDFEMNITIEPFPSKKERDQAYKVWVETFVKAITKK